MNPIRLLALDLDGTLISASDLRVSPAVKAAIGRARDAGVAITMVTGRMFEAALPFAESIGIEGPIVCYQGAATYVVATRRRLAHVPVPIALGQQVFARAAADGVRALGYLEDQLFSEADDKYTRWYTDLAGVRAQIVPSLCELFKDRSSTKINCVLEAERAGAYAEELRRFVGAGGYVTRSNPEYVEVMSPEVDKGRALGVVARYYDTSLEATMAVGDSWNDVPLLDAAGFAVAMANAPPELLAAADATVASVEHDGVAEAIERFVVGSGTAR
ncbi:MAG: HAD family phosphatase [Candidatus Eremiobacteraeota bacterium]|nr:HAD family phosphatase [Candidatus Eremiobacteraeota bacterium]